MSDDFTPLTNTYTRPGTTQLRLHAGSRGGYLTAAAVREYFDDVDTVTMAVDRDHSQLGIQPGPDGPGDPYTLTKLDCDAATFAVKNALRDFGIDLDDLEDNWGVELEEDGRYVVADVTNLVEHVVGAVHCGECGQRFKSERAKNSHYGEAHDDLKEVLEETDPDAVGEPFPKGDGGRA
jgi:hypothetical protein